MLELRQGRKLSYIIFIYHETFVWRSYWYLSVLTSQLQSPIRYLYLRGVPEAPPNAPAPLV